MAELFGKKTGVSRGRGGSMHLFDVEERLLGGYAIVGGQLPLATGAALALIYRGEPGRTRGRDLPDGRRHHQHRRLPRVAEPRRALEAAGRLRDRQQQLRHGHHGREGRGRAGAVQGGCAYGMHGERVDGNDVLAVRDAAAGRAERARTERQPELLETISFRLRGHSVVDPDRYRSARGDRAAARQDPLPPFGPELLERRRARRGRRAARSTQQVEQQVDAASRSPTTARDPDPATLFDYAYATPVPNAPHRLPGDPVADLRRPHGDQ